MSSGDLSSPLLDPFEAEINEMSSDTNPHEYICMRNIYQDETKRPTFENVDSKKYSQFIKIIEGIDSEKYYLFRINYYRFS